MTQKDQTERPNNCQNIEYGQVKTRVLDGQQQKIDQTTVSGRGTTSRWNDWSKYYQHMSQITTFKCLYLNI